MQKKQKRKTGEDKEQKKAGDKKVPLPTKFHANKIISLAAPVITSLEGFLHQRATKVDKRKVPQYLIDEGRKTLQEVTMMKSVWKQFYTRGALPKGYTYEGSQKTLKDVGTTAKNLETMLNIAVTFW